MTDEPLLPCDHEVFSQGKPLLAADTFDCGARGFDAWVRELATRSGQQVDWHYSGGVASVLFLGDLAPIITAAKSLTCPARIMRWFADGDPGLYRKGVTQVPPRTFLGWYEGGTGSVYASGEPEP